MKVDVKEVSTVLKEISFELPVDETKPEEEKLITELSKSVKIKGFRPGKVPKDIIRGRFKGDIEAQLADKIVNAKVEEFLKESKIEPIAAPNLKEINYELGSAMSFTVEVEINPEFEIKDIDKVKVKPEKVKVTGKEIDDELENLRKRSAELLPVEDRGVQEGDLLSLGGTYEEPHDDHSHEHEMKRRSYPMPEKKGEFSEFDKNVAGMKKGEEKSFEILVDNDKFGASLKDKKIKFNIIIEDLHEIKLPDVDDEFAKTLGEFDNLKALKEEIKKHVHDHKVAQERKRLGEEMLDQLKEANPFEIPKAFVDREVDNVLYMTAARMINMGVNPRHTHMDWEKMREDARPTSEENVARMMVVMKIAEANSIEIPDKEVEEQIEAMATERRTNPDSLKEEMKKSGEFGRLRSDMLYNRIVDFLLEKNDIRIE